MKLVKDRYMKRDRFAKNTNPYIIYLSNSDLFGIKYNLSVSEMENDYSLGFKEWKIVANNVNLSKREKQCLYLYYWMGLTQKEISYDLNIVRQVVGTYLQRAKNKIAIYFNINIDNIDRNEILDMRNK